MKKSVLIPMLMVFCDGCDKMIDQEFYIAENGKDYHSEGCKSIKKEV